MNIAEKLALAKKLRCQRAAEDVNVFASYVGRDERTGKPIKQAGIHREMHKVLDESSRVVVWGFVESGKCTPAEAPVYLADGTVREIATITEVVEVVLEDPATMTTRTALAGPVFENGVRTVYTVRTKAGRILRVTANHPLFTVEGWREASTLCPGEYIATARTMPGPKTPGDLSPEDAELLGYLCGYGGLSVPGHTKFTKVDPDVVARVRYLCAAHGWGMTGSPNGKDYTLTRGEATETPWAWVASHGLNHLSKHKRVPKAVWKAGLPSVASFLGAYFACAGYVHRKRGLEWSSASRGLMDDTRLLLARFGVVCRLKDRTTAAVKGGRRFPSTRLLITGREALTAFVAAIPVVGPKGAALRTLEGLSADTRTGRLSTVDDVVPAGWREAYHRPVRPVDCVRHRFSAVRGHGNHRSVIRRLLAEEPDAKVSLLCSDAVYWDRIERIDVGAPEMTYGIEVHDPAHCYLQGDAISHNSEQLVVTRILHALGRDPSLRIGLIGNTMRQSEKTLKKIALAISGNPDLREVFPNLRPGAPWRDAAITVARDTAAKDPSIQAIGVHGSVLGSRLDLVFMDDVVDFENSRSDKARRDLIDWVLSTVFGRLTEDARVVVLGNAFHPEDLLHVLEKLPGWRGVRFPVLNAAGESVWPERWPLDRINARRDEVGPLEFARTMLCQPRSDEDSRFKRDDIDACLDLGRGLGPVLPGRLSDWRPNRVPPGEDREAYKQRCRFYTGVDLAVQQHAAADLTAVFTLAVHPDGMRELVGLSSGRFPAMEILRLISSTVSAWGSIAIVENVAAQDWMLQFARELYNVAAKPFTTGRGKASLEFQAESLAAEVASHRWIIPCGPNREMHPEVREWVAALLFYSPASHTPDRMAASLFARYEASQGDTRPKGPVAALLGVPGAGSSRRSIWG